MNNGKINSFKNTFFTEIQNASTQIVIPNNETVHENHLKFLQDISLFPRVTIGCYRHRYENKSVTAKDVFDFRQELHSALGRNVFSVFTFHPSFSFKYIRGNTLHEKI